MSGAPAASLPLVFGDHPDQVTDLYLPDGTEPGLPLLLFFHGGFWRAEHDRGHVTGFVRDLAAETGCAVAGVEYRRVGGAGGWPVMLTDTARAAAGRIDPERVVYVGHSAGGHLALWAALRHRLPEGAPGRTATPPTVLALAPTADLTWADELDSGRGGAPMGFVKGIGLRFGEWQGSMA
ncbi:alpha/beta hydrolase [Streptomyces sp. NPDC052107]|uniref:alpha/beta hydrolase n=1 Tax=Streptomyces sp. NPDC052107 TaxID=3155632 RepID=UPI00341AB52E